MQDLAQLEARVAKLEELMRDVAGALRSIRTVLEGHQAAIQPAEPLPSLLFRSELLN
jgi:hypothetical protein